MNHIYIVVWNAVLGRFCVASELGRNRKRATSQRGAGPGAPSLRPTALAVLMALAWAAPGWARLPEGLTLVNGSATVATQKTHMTITQTSPKAILEWQKFNVSRGHQVTFEQPNRHSIALNRVVGSDASLIRGRIQSNGHVFLVNPNGVLFGKYAQVDVGGLVASTLDISNADFMAGDFKFSLSGPNKPAAVINRGEITAATHGAVALLGGDVSNEGKVSAHLGVVSLAAGQGITLNLNGGDNLQVVIDAPALKASVINSGTLEADGGRVWMTAEATDALLQTVINNSGHIKARTVGGNPGQIILWASGEGAVAQVSGRLDAGADQGAGGAIGIEGSHVKILRGTHITTLANAGETGLLSVQANELRLSAGGSEEEASQIDADHVADTLTRSHVTLRAKNGSIQVDAPVKWSQKQLSLAASDSININAPMTASGTASLLMDHGGYAFNQETIQPGSGVNMGLSADGFTGRVEFKDVLDQSHTDNLRLIINREGYTLLTHVGDQGSTSKVDLQGIDGGLDGNFALAADIDAAQAQKFKSIGSQTKPFSGRFEGLGNQIADLNIDRRGESHVGLFAVSEGSIRNLALKHGSVKGSDGAQIVAGSVVGELRAGGTIANVHTTAAVHAHSDQSDSAKAIAGNLVGRINAGNLTNVHALGSVSAEAFSNGKLAHAVAGGAVGHLQSGGVTQTQAAGPVTVSARSRRLVLRRDERGAPIFDPGLPPVYAEGTATSYAGGAIGVNGSGDIENVSATGLVTDMSTGLTAVSMHALVGNARDAMRGRAGRLHAVQAVPDQPPPTAVPARPAPAPETMPAMVAVNAAVQHHATADAPVQPMAPEVPAAPAPEMTPVAVAVNTAVHLRAGAASAAKTLDVAPSQAVAIRQSAPETPAIDRAQGSVASVSKPAQSASGIDVDAGQTVAVPTQPGVHASPQALPADTFAQAIDTHAAVEVAATEVARGMPVAAPSVVAVDIAAAKAQPSAAAREVSAGMQPGEMHPGVRIRSRATYAGAMAAVAGATRAEPASALPATNEGPLYTVIGDGILRPAR